jgi:carbonic anhydrase/acetyltransferase-like protein (isoleucine patch superfamily)
MGLSPSLWQGFRQLIGRAFRETGQSLDRLGVKTVSWAVTPHDYYDDPVIYEDHLSRHRQLFPLLISGRPVIHPNIAYIAPCATLIGSVFVGKNTSIWYGAVLRGDTCENTESFHTKYTIETGEPPHDSSTATTTHRLDSMETSRDHSSSAMEQPTRTTTVPTTTTTNVSNTEDTTFAVHPRPWKLSATRYRDQLDHHGGAIFIGDDTNVQDSCIITAYQEHCQIGNGVTIGHAAQLHSCTVHDYSLIGMGSIINPGVIVESEAFIAAGAVVPENTVVPSGTLWMGNPAKLVRHLTPEQRQKLHYQSSEYVQVASTHKHVMELGGNVDPQTGVSVCITSEDQDGEDTLLHTTPADNEFQQLQQVSSSTSDVNQQQLPRKGEPEMEGESMKISSTGSSR